MKTPLQREPMLTPMDTLNCIKLRRIPTIWNQSESRHAVYICQYQADIESWLLMECNKWPSSLNILHYHVYYYHCCSCSDICRQLITWRWGRIGTCDCMQRVIRRGISCTHSRDNAFNYRILFNGATQQENREILEIDADR